MNLEGKTFLITGGTVLLEVLYVIIFKKQSERNTYIYRDENKQYQMRRKIHDSRVSFYWDIRDFDSVIDSLDEINYVFHAAALKQVPSYAIRLKC